MSRPLFAITEDFKQLDQMLDQLDQADIPYEEREQLEASLMAWLQSLNDEQRDKVDAYCWIVKQLEAEAETAREVAREFQEKVVARERRVELLKGRMLEHMIAIEQEKLVGHKMTVKVTKNGGRLPLVFSADVLPEEYFYTPDPLPDTNKIRAALEAGKEVAGARIGEQGKHLRIR